MFCILYFIFASFLLLFLRIYWLQRKSIALLRKGNLPILKLHPVWFYIIKEFLPKNQDFNSKVRRFQLSSFSCRLFDKERIYASSVAGECSVHLFKPEHIEVVLSSNTVIDKSWLYKFAEPWVGKGLLTSSGESWRTRRKLLTPAFHFKILENFLPMINKHSNFLVEKIKKKDQPWLNILHLMSLCTLDIIGETAMGVEIRAQENEESEYVKASERIEQIYFARLMSVWLWPDIIFNISPSGREFYKLLNIIHSFSRQVISKKTREITENFEDIQSNEKEDDENIYMKIKNKKALLHLLLHHHFNNGDISAENIREEVDTFMFAGHETTAVGISWALYNIGLYPDIQQKVHNELQLVFCGDKTRSITQTDLKEMKYLECVVKESLRLYPPGPMIIRSNLEDFKLNDKITIPGGSSIFIGIYAMHHDPELYPNPEIFDPDRFLPENSVGRHPYAFIPFSAGPRNCIGQRLALMEEKIVISNILRHFWIKSLDPPDKIMESGDIVLRPENELRIEFRRKMA